MQSKKRHPRLTLMRVVGVLPKEVKTTEDLRKKYTSNNGEVVTDNEHITAVKEDLNRLYKRTMAFIETLDALVIK